MPWARKTAARELAKALYIEDCLRACGVSDIRRLDAADPRVPSGLRPNVVARIPGRSSRTLWLFAHMDVVPPGDPALWHSDPWQVVRQGDMLVGRGVEDNQQGLVSMLLLAEALHACDITPELSLGLVFMADEECGNDYGLAHVLERHAALPEGERFLRADDFYIVPDSGSPTGADIEVAEKCLCWLKVDVSGVQCHASTPHKGRNAFVAGAAAVLATLVACAGDELPRRVVGIMACAENMPGGNAMRPGDVVRAASGDTVEIQNTDAEGRLALCDALDYAQKQWTPAAVVDIATLTGACAVALGTQVAGLFCDDDALAEHIRAAGAVGGENYWPLPLWKGYEDNLKSEVADICHMGPREGGAIHAALFLKHFVREGVRWAHLDIAGVDWATKKTALCPVGSTGFGARTLLELARGGV